MQGKYARIIIHTAFESMGGEDPTSKGRFFLIVNVFYSIYVLKYLTPI